MSNLTIRNYDPVWSTLGKAKGRHATWAEVEADAKLDFAVFKSQLHDGLGRPVDAYGTFRWNAEDIRSGDKSGAVFLGTVGKDYEILPHAQGFSIMDALIGEQTGGAHYVTAGEMDGGAVVWGMADLGLTTRVGDDEHKNYLLFATSHDGRTSWVLKAVNRRVICENSFYYALREETQSVFTVRHTKNAKERIVQAHQTLRSYTNDVRTAEQKLRWLAGRKVTRESMTKILNRLFPQTSKEVEEGGKLVKVDFSSKQRDRVLADVLERYEFNDGDAFPEQRGSAYNLFNAVTNFVDHGKGKAETRAESAMFGAGSKLKSEAFDTILAEARTMPDLVRVDFKAQVPVIVRP